MKRLFITILFLWSGIVNSQELDFSIRPSDRLVELKKEQIETGLDIYTFYFKVDTLDNPIHIEWESPSENTFCYWTTRGSGFTKPEWGARLITSYATSQAPVVALFDNSNNNKITFAASDALNPVTLSSGVIEETAMIINRVSIGSKTFNAKKTYSVSIRVDQRDIPYWQALQETSGWWAGMKNYEPMQVPDKAKRPMYSTWYSFHQQLETTAVIKNCRIAKKFGCDAIIVDDGWQTNDNNRGYAFTGDWKPERIPEMKAFVDSVHQVGMKFLLWYSVPYIGENSQVFEEFSDKLLAFHDGRGAGVLDPRYPEVRNYLINTYVTAMNEWGLDGFKLDFVDLFRAGSNAEYKEGMDFHNVNEATDKLLTDIKNTLTSINSNVLIEFRQRYIGPLMRKYGNMFRASDCPYSVNENRSWITDVRLLAGSTATHSDMIMWHPEEDTETAALQLLNVMFSVPQISVRLDEFPKQHIDMLEFWLGFWNKNRDALLDGEFEAHFPNFNYPLLVGKTDSKMIAGAYQPNMLINIDDDSRSFSEVSIINATDNGKLIVCSKKEALYSCKIYDCMGNSIKEDTIKLNGIHEFPIPKSGLLELKLK